MDYYFVSPMDVLVPQWFRLIDLNSPNLIAWMADVQASFINTKKKKMFIFVIRYLNFDLEEPTRCLFCFQHGNKRFMVNPGTVLRTEAPV